MAFRDLTDVLGATPPKALPIHGEQVTFPPRVSARTGMLLLAVQHRADAGEDVESVVDSVGLDNEAAAELERDLLGEEGMRRLDALGVIGDARAHVVGTLIAWHLRGEAAAVATWEAGPVTPGKGPAASNRATRRKTAGRSSKAAGAAAARSTAGSSSARTSGGASSSRRTAKVPATRRGSSSAGRK